MKIDRRLLFLIVLAASFFTTPLVAQFWQQESKLVASGGEGNQGRSVAISADGNTVLVGGERTAWVWTRSGGVWSLQDALVGSGAVPMVISGVSVGLSADGNTAIVGNSGDNNNVGAAWVWMRNGTSWAQQGPKLVGSGAIGAARQGVSVNLAEDGNTAIVGGSADNGFAGAAWVWTRSGGVWTQDGSKLVGSGSVGPARQGISVALSADGNIATVGGNTDNGGTGATWVWLRNSGVWTQDGSKLVGSGTSASAQQGTSVAIAADGNTIMSGGPGDSAAWVWLRIAGAWSQQGPKLVAPSQGSSVSLSGDGGIAVIGAPFADPVVVGNILSTTGAAWMWTRTSGVWTVGQRLVGTNGVGAFQGASVSISADGNTVVVGGPFDSGGTGAAWVFSALIPTIPLLSDVGRVLLLLSFAALAALRLR